MKTYAQCDKHFPLPIIVMCVLLLRPSWKRYRRVILLGQNVAKAFGVAHLQPLFWWTKVDDKRTRVAIVPHPSGVNRWYNSAWNRTQASLFLRKALR